MGRFDGGSDVKEHYYETDHYVVRRKVLKLFGGAFHIYDGSGRVILYSRLKAFKLKEDIRIWTGEDCQTEVLLIRARQIIDFSSAYDIFDPATGARLGACKRRGWKSLMRDEWTIMDAEDRDIAKIEEDSLILALIRRLLTNLVPQRYTVTMDGETVAEFRQNFNPFVLKLKLDFSPDRERRLDRRLGLAAAVLLCAIEGRQN